MHHNALIMHVITSTYSVHLWSVLAIASYITNGVHNQHVQVICMHVFTATHGSYIVNGSINVPQPLVIMLVSTGLVNVDAYNLGRKQISRIIIT